MSTLYVDTITEKTLGNGVQIADLVPAAGSVVQVVSAASTGVLSTTSQSFADLPGMSASITPQSATSKILITYVNHVYVANISPAPDWQAACTNLLRDSTLIREEGTSGYYTGHNTASTNDRFMDYQTIVYYDSPATTSTITYKLQGAAKISAGSIIFNDFGYAKGGTITLMEIAQ
jgi:hypothetical protein